MKAQSLIVEGNSILLPSSADLVEGLDNAIEKKINEYDSTTVTTRLNGLSSVYLGKTAKAESAKAADTATQAAHADNADNANSAGYANESGKARNDANGDPIHTTYAKINGTYSGLTAGKANVAELANKARTDKNDKDITTYVSNIAVSGRTLTVTHGSGVNDTFTTQDTTYSNATTAHDGLMSAADKLKLDNLSAAKVDKAAYADKAGTADALTNSARISIGGGASGSVLFNGASDVNLTLGSINASSITSGTLSTRRGGTGSTDGTVAKLATARTINGVKFDGSADCIYYGECTTPGNQATKKVVIPNFQLTVGAIIWVQFDEINTAANPTLLVDGTTAFPMGMRDPNNQGWIRITNQQFPWAANEIVAMQFTGQAWDCLSYDPISKINFTGAITGSGVLEGKSGTYTIETTLNQKNAFLSAQIKPEDFDYDIANVKEPGFYRIQQLNHWAGVPSNTGSNHHNTLRSYYLQVFKSGSSKTYIQQLINAWVPDIYYRCYPNGEAIYPWYKPTTTEFEATDAPSGAAAPESTQSVNAVRSVNSLTAFGNLTKVEYPEELSEFDDFDEIIAEPTVQSVFVNEEGSTGETTAIEGIGAEEEG